MPNLAPELLRQITEDSPLRLDYGEWGWLGGREPVSPALVKRWLAAGLLDDYGVSTMVLSSKGRTVAFGKPVSVSQPAQMELSA